MKKLLATTSVRQQHSLRIFPVYRARAFYRCTTSLQYHIERKFAHVSSIEVDVILIKETAMVNEECLAHWIGQVLR